LLTENTKNINRGGFFLSDKIMLPYGNKMMNIKLNKKNVNQVITPNRVNSSNNINKKVKEALNNPIGCETLEREIFKISKEQGIKPDELDIVIISDDNTRLTPVDKILPCILKKMKNTGIKYSQIKIIMALGTHRNMSKEEMKNKVGNKIYEKVKVLNHNFRDKSQLVDLGLTDNGTPISINKFVYKADLVIGLGSIVPHHIPGFSGGAKIIQPGVSGGKTTGYTHLLSVKKRRSFLGYIENPVRKEMEEIAKKVKANYIINAVLDRSGNIYKLFYGDIVSAFREGVKAAKKVYQVNVKAKTDVTIANSYPCNIEFWQAHKSLYPADIITNEGGMIIILAPCYEGVAVTHKTMLKFTSLSPHEIESRIKSGRIKDIVAAALAMAWAKISSRYEVVLVSEGISPEETEALNFTYAASINEAIGMAKAKHGDNVKMNILTHAPDTLPVLS